MSPHGCSVVLLAEHGQEPAGGAAHAASTLRGLAMAQDHAMGRGYGGFPALGFRSGGMYKPLPGCRNKSPQSFCWALPMGVFLCAAPPQRLCPSFAAGSGGQRGMQPQSTALLGTAVESPPLWGRTAAPACVGGWKLQPPDPGSCEPAAVGGRCHRGGMWVMACSKLAPMLPGSEAGRAPCTVGAGQAAPTKAS